MFFDIPSTDETVRRARRAAGDKNLLTSAMIERLRYRARRLMNIHVVRPKIDIETLYLNWRKKCPPAFSDLVSTTSVGMFIARCVSDGAPVYISFWVPGYGGFFLRTADENDLQRTDRGALMQFLDALVETDISVVAQNRADIQSMHQIVSGRSPDMRIPSCRVVDKNWESAIDGKVDMVSWEVDASIARSHERMPKNPVPDSFSPKWHLRKDQMIYLILNAALVMAE